MKNLLTLNGYKTYIAAVGLVGLAIYHATIGNYEQMIQTGLAALAAFGLRQAISKID